MSGGPDYDVYQLRFLFQSAIKMKMSTTISPVERVLRPAML